MTLPLSHAIVPTLEVIDEIGSTNAELVARASARQLDDFTVIMTTNQTAGRGRLDRVWVAPPGRTIAVSVLLAPENLPVERLGWIPLLAGLAMTRAVASLAVDHTVTLKWPNDVQVDGLKVSGLLTQLVTDPVRVVVGAGLNLTITADELPVPTATSLTLVGVSPAELVDRALAAYLGELRELHGAFHAADWNPEVALRREVSAACSTLGSAVRVELAEGDFIEGVAEDLDGLGRLLVRVGGELRAVAAGDVTHLRNA